jgi:hypothetical protein
MYFARLRPTNSFYGFSSKPTSSKRVANNRKCLEIALTICNNDTNRGGVKHEFSIPKSRNLIFEFLIRIQFVSSFAVNVSR